MALNTLANLFCRNQKKRGSERVKLLMRNVYTLGVVVNVEVIRLLVTCDVALSVSDQFSVATLDN